MRLTISVSLRLSVGWISSRSMALARIFSRFNPPPSSETWITMLPESWKAFSETFPHAGLPRARRSSTGSMPWSSELRTRCISGSPIFSTTLLSSSVSAPVMISSISLPRSLETSRTTRLKRVKVSPICTMRSCSAESRMLSTRRESTEVASTRSLCRPGRVPVALRGLSFRQPGSAG